MAARTVAILYGTKGGMGDVGKFAVMQALKTPGLTVRPVALSMEAEEGEDNGVLVDFDKCPKTKHRCPADVDDADARAKLKASFDGIEIQKMDIAADSTQSKLEKTFEGVDAIVMCTGNRQPGMARWCTLAAEKVIAASNAKGVKRVVVLSSMGIGDDYLPISFIKCLWWCMLQTMVRSAKNDLIAMESAIMASDCDFLIVRPMGIDPSEKATGKWKLVQNRGEGGLPITVSKEDVAAFMLSEALTPSIHKKAVTIGKDS
eukprot:CAMPEP_0181314952 /NCGR_PEP_ID=MMETSP1101-20121128/15102_1 /TAXON_ID=46948 /ORGANISM="Rhodomonas abbreviata, Strain Caron Lab Isolate" /LENGTH=259 /DNA_ID=CAMNT_0023422099 /DNA_START=21 /DNA_END=800 /DNA_ORIENTATION=-